MKNFKFIILLVILISTSTGKIYAQSQNKMGYSYDGNGNRTQRYFIGALRPARTDSVPGDTLAGPTDMLDSTKAIKKERELAMKYGVSVYPNPTQDRIQVSINKAGMTESQKATVYLIDSNGRTVDTKTYRGTEIGFDLSGSPPGNYYLNIIFESKERLSYSVIKVN